MIAIINVMAWLLCCPRYSVQCSCQQFQDVWLLHLNYWWKNGSVFNHTCSVYVYIHASGRRIIFYCALFLRV